MYMTKQHFSFKEIFAFGWARTKQHAWFVALSIVLISIITSAVERNHFMCMVVSLMCVLSIVSVSLLISRGHSFSFHDFITPLLSPKKVLKFFAVTGVICIPALLLISPLIAGIALRDPMFVRFGALLLIPLIYLSTRLKFYPYVVLENENASVKELLKISYKLTANRFLSVFTFLLLATLLNILGIALIGFGLLVTMPVTIFAFAHMYDKLKNHTA